MKINVSKILKAEGEGLSFAFQENINEIENFLDVHKFLSPVKVEGTVTNIGGVFKVEAKGSVEAKLACYRCLRAINTKIDIEVNENFSNTGSEEEAETFLGDTIDLKSVVGQSILLGLPMKVICDENCKGLCPICGKDLNEGDCDCETSNIDPRFESLRSLFKLDEEV